MKRVLVDLEADGFLATVTKVHCIAAVDVDTQQRSVWGPHEIDEALRYLASADVLIGHNIQRYDLPVIKKVYPGWWQKTSAKIFDTYLAARVLYADIQSTDSADIASGKLPNKLHDGSSLQGKHSLEAWGYRLGERKASFDGPWDCWSQTMQDYMVQDVTTNLKLYQRLIGCADKKSVHYFPAFESALELEHEIATLCDLIEECGIPFDLPSAGRLHAALATKRDEAEAQLKAQFDPWLAPISPTPAKHEFTPKKDNAKLGYVAGQTVCKLKVVEFSPGSRDHIAKVLKDRGWAPASDQMTPGGKPQINEGIVAGLVLRYPELAGLSDYMMLCKRISQLATGDEAWIGHVKEDGRIHGAINPMGTITSRAAHMKPNLGQVPACKKPYGKECRELFYVPDEWEMLGADKEGLELRGLAHYLKPYDGGEYERLILSGDPHWRNTQLVGLVDPNTARDKASPLHTVLRESGGKRFTYASIYGCGGKRGGEIILAACLDAKHHDGGETYRRFFGNAKQPGVGKLTSVGKKAVHGLLHGIKGFAELKERLSWQVEHFGWVPGLDGRRIPVRSEHSALNFLIQSAGAILCKRWGVDAVRNMRDAGLSIGWHGDVVPLLWVHDEYQFAIRRGLAPTVGPIVTNAAQAAGERYGFRVRLDSKYVVGRTWADTH